MYNILIARSRKFLSGDGGLRDILSLRGGGPRHIFGNLNFLGWSRPPTLRSAHDIIQNNGVLCTIILLYVYMDCNDISNLWFL